MSTMTPRQRVLATLRREEPDRVPRELVFGYFTPALMEIFREKTGAEDPAEYWNFEVRPVSFRYPDPAPRILELLGPLPPGATVDAWGIGTVPGSFYHFWRFVHPLASATTAREMIDYPLPDLQSPPAWQHLGAEVAALHARDLAAMGELYITIFEIGWYMRGMTNLLTDFAVNPEMAEVLVDRITALRCFQAEKFAQAGVDILRLGDDVSQQRGMLMSPAMWRKWLKPRLAKVIAAARVVRPDILVFYHSDGDCRAIVPELIEIGINILNPVQPECMDPAEMKRLYGDRLAFWGTVGTQTTFPFGTPAEMKAVVRGRVQTVGRGGGLLLAPTHILEPEVPWENIIAFFAAIDEFGVYEN
ncbi:MAG: hypothetical protein IT330_14630 [Anaerolineae bacterium]|nr:hypothetical protein [Anaerolineae bacterium]